MVLVMVCIEVRDSERSFNMSGLDNSHFYEQCARIRKGNMGGGLMHRVLTDQL